MSESGGAPSLELDPTSEEYKARHREAQTAFWRERLREWDWFCFIETLKQMPQGAKMKLGSRRTLMEGTGVRWIAGMGSGKRFVEEWCFDQALREAAAEHGLELTFDTRHGLWLNLRHEATEPAAGA